jgi:hypothetical protein
MKTITLLLFSIFLLVGATNSAKAKIQFEKLENKSVIGDFNGDKKLDTLFEIHTSKNEKNGITEIPFIDDYDTMVDYYYKNSIQTSLKSSNKKIKNLDLGTSFGVYCLINIGDNNNDKKEELALVIDYCDFSNLNSCRIYSLCNNNWTMIHHFAIHEAAFEYADGETLDPNKIGDYLQKKKGKWFYADAFEVLESDDSIVKMKPLKIKKCN